MKIKPVYVVVAAIGVSAGAALYYFRDMEPLATYVTPHLSAVTPTLNAVGDSVSMKIKEFTSFLFQHPIEAITATIGVAAPVMVFANSLYVKAKEHITHEADQKVSAVTGEMAKLAAENKTLNDQLLEYEQKDSTITQLRSGLTEAQQLVTQKTGEIDKLRAEIEGLNRTITNLKVNTIEKVVVK